MELNKFDDTFRYNQLYNRVLVLRILAIGDTANNAYMMSQIVFKTHMDIINFPRIGAAKLTYSGNVRFFKSHLISDQVKEINHIKSDYDLCFVSSWEGARVAYLANLNYIFFFVGGDILEQPFIKNARTSYLNEPIHQKSFFERWFLKQVLQSAIACVTYGGKDFLEKLKKFHSNVYRMDMIPVDPIFFKKHFPINKEKKKFTFLSPQRFGPQKGSDIIWEAVELTKSDFIILQLDWFDKRNLEEKRIGEKLRKTKSEKIKFIPMIPWNEMPSYYTWADAVMGQMRFRHGGIEREAVLCGTPVLNYNDINETYLINNQECVSNFLPNSNDPKDLAKIIDKVVEDEKFRKELHKNELEFVLRLTDPKIIGEYWDDIFEKVFNICHNINRNQSFGELKIWNFVTKVMENLIYKKKWKYKEI